MCLLNTLVTKVKEKSRLVELQPRLILIVLKMNINNTHFLILTFLSNEINACSTILRGFNF